MKTILIVMAAMLLLSGCSKSKENVPAVPDMTNQYKPLIVGEWSYSARTISPAYDWDNDGTLDTEVFSKMNPCTKVFKLSLTTTGGTVLLSCNMPVKSLTWKLEENGTKLKCSLQGGGGITEKIISLNATTLVTKSEMENPVGVFYTLTNTYTKQ
jgi:hypothetical protein